MSPAQRTDPRPSGDALDSQFAKQVERFRSLRSAWGALSPSALAVEKRDIAALGRALNEAMARIARQGAARCDAHLLDQLEVCLTSFEREMREVALCVPLAQLRSTLPAQIAANRRSVLDLLDLILGAEIEGRDGTEERIPAIDYLITLLCLADPEKDEQNLNDPVTLTPRLHQLCQRTGDEYDPRLPQIEAEFFAAADLYEAEVRSNGELQSLARRKMELGTSYFAPGVLRSIVTYNAALSERVEDEAVESQDWGALEGEPESEAEGACPITTGSVFESSAVRELAAAVRRRAAGGAPEAGTVDRIAWTLDLDVPSRLERAHLLSPSVGSPEELRGTAVLIGLMCRAASALEAELPAIGVSPHQLATEWVAELDEAIKQEVTRLLGGDHYQDACALSELRNEFLYVPMSDVHRRNRAPRKPRSRPSGGSRITREAQEIAREAIGRARTGERARPPWADWPWATLAGIAASVALAAAVVALVANALGSGAALESYGRDELARVSPYLVEGARNGDGSGTSFVGTIHESWAALDPDARERVSDRMVDGLRADGLRQIMIYDEARQLRIQALGSRPPRILADAT